MNITLSALVPLRLDAANLTMQRREDGVRKQHALETQARVIPARTAASCQGKEKKKKNPSPISGTNKLELYCAKRLRRAAEDLSDSTAARFF